MSPDPATKRPKNPAIQQTKSHGTVVLDGHDGHPLPLVLTSAAWGVLETWMLEQDDDNPMSGSTVIPMDGWRELFGHRLQVA